MATGYDFDFEGPRPIPDVRTLVNSAIDTGGAAPFINYEGEWRSWRWLRNYRQALDQHAASIGMEPGHAVALVARNHPDHVAAMAAQTAGGRLTSMVYSAQSASRIAAEVEQVAAPLVLASKQDWTPELFGIVERQGGLGLALAAGDYPQIVVQGTSVPARDYPKRDPQIAFELLSSGTTGSPKRVPLSWSTVSSSTHDAGGAYAGTAGSLAPQIMLHPLGNVAGIAYLLPILANRQSVVLLEKFDLAAWVEAVRRFRPARGSLPPAGVRMVYDADVAAEALASLKVIAVGGGKLDPQLQEAFEQRYRIPLLTAFGATEFAGVVANWSIEDYRNFGRLKRGSSGRASRNVELRVVDKDSFDVLPAGEVGLLEAKVDRLGNGWIRTNDLARIDGDGFLFVEGRADDAINRGGFKIVPETVAAALRQFPGVADAAVVGVPDSRLGEVPAAAVELQVGASVAPEALLEFLRAQLLSYQVPVEVRIVSALPRNLSMKVALQEVRALFACAGDS